MMTSVDGRGVPDSLNSSVSVGLSCITRPQNPQLPEVIITGVDTLHAIFPYRLREDIYNQLVVEKDLAIGDPNDESSPRIPRPITLCGMKLLLMPGGTKGFRFFLKNEDISIAITGKNVPEPQISVQFRAQFLWTMGYWNAWLLVKGWIQKLVEEPDIRGLVSRIDLCVDSYGWEPKQHDLDSFVTRARKKRIYLDGHQFTGFSFGEGGSIVARIYNKTLEIMRNCKDWEDEVWGNNSGGETVWRTEIQFRREALIGIKVGKKFIDTVEDAFTNLGALWEYATGNWISFRIPGKKMDRSTWSVRPEWMRLSEAKFGTVPFPAIRDRKRAKKLSAQIQNLLGSLTSLGAKLGTKTLPETIQKVQHLLAQNLIQREILFSHLIEAKKSQSASHVVDVQPLEKGGAK